MRNRFIKKLSKKLISLLLVLTVTVSMFASFDLTVLAEDTTAAKLNADGEIVFSNLWDGNTLKNSGTLIIKK